jgi:glycosyltransferase involved in cell wall biosynthesis
VAQVGRLAPQKDWPTFLRAMARVTADVHDVDVLVVGTGEQRPSLEALAAGLGLGGRVTFLGLRHDVPDLLAASDVLALTSLYEGLPNVVIEAMAMGAVAVATDVGGTAELVQHEVTGLLVQPRDVDGIAMAIRRVLDDGVLAARLATAARAFVECELSVETMVARTMRVYDERLAAHGLADAA